MASTMDKDPDDAGVSQVWDEQGRRFTRKQIDDPAIYAEYLHEKILRDELFRRIVAVRKSTRNQAHFRVHPQFEDGARIDPGEKNPLHDDTVKVLHRRLTQASSIEVHTTKFDSQGGRHDETIWQSNSLRPLRWKCDPLTRIWLDRENYFQPDLCAFDPEAAYPGPHNPWVIIEVVHTHWPDEPAWNALTALSKANHLVLFYFVRGKTCDNWVNKTFGTDNFCIKTAFYLRDGELYQNSKKLYKPTGAIGEAARIKLDVLTRKDATLDKEEDDRRKNARR